MAIDVDRGEIIEYARLHGAAAAGEKFGVSAGTVRSWKHRKGTDATAEPDAAPAVEPGPPGWPVISVDVPRGPAGSFIGQPFGADGIAREPTASIRARQMQAGEGRTVVSLSDAQHLRVPVADAEAITDGDILAAGSIAVRVMGRRRADLDREGHALTVDAETRERLSRFVLLRVEPARVAA